MSAYAAPANWNPIFDPKKFFNIPTANINTGTNYTNEINAITNDLEISNTLLNEFTSSAGLQNGTPMDTNSVTELAIYPINTGGSQMICYNVCLNLPSAWTYAIIWTYTLIAGKASNQQPIVVWNYLNTNNGTMNLPTLAASFFYNVNNATEGDTITISMTVVAPSNFSYTAFYGTSNTNISTGYNRTWIKFTNQNNPYQV